MTRNTAHVSQTARYLDGPGGHLDGRVAVVTGGGRGIGRSVAMQMAAEGARVLVCDKGTAVDDSSNSDATVAQAVVDEISAAGGESLAASADVTRPDEVEAAFQVAVAGWGPVDIVVNAAGIIRDRMVWNIPEREWDDVMGVHLKSCYSLTSTLARHLRATRKDDQTPSDVSLTTFSSSAGVFGNVGSSSYGTAKAGVNGFTRIAALELAKYGVRANCVVPFAYTRMADSLPTESAAARERLEGIRQLSTDQVAGLVVWLAACRDPAVTGQLLGLRGRELMVFSQPRIETRVMLERTDVRGLSDSIGDWLPSRLPPLEAAGDIFDYQPYA